MSLRRTYLPARSGNDHRFKTLVRDMASCCCLFLVVIALASCGQVDGLFNGKSNTSANTTNSATQAQNAPIAPLNSPPGASERPLQPGQSGTVYTDNGLPALQPPRGMNVDNLFAADIRDTDKRFDRLENAVKDLRKEFEAVKPSVIRLVSVEQDIQNLVEQLEILLQTEPPAAENQAYVQNAAPQPTQQAPAGSPVPLVNSTAPPAAIPTPPPEPVAESPPAAPTPPAAAPPTPASTSGPDVRRLRIGEHSDKTRIVLDVSQKTPYTLDLDNGENLLIIELPNSSWSGQKAWQSSRSPLLASYSVQPMNNGQGSRLIVQLKHASNVVKESVLDASGSNPVRIVIDLKSTTVH